MRSDSSFAGKNRPNEAWSRVEQENANSDLFRQPSVSMGFPFYQTIYSTSHEFTRDFLDKHEPRHNNHEQFSHKTLRGEYLRISIYICAHSTMYIHTLYDMFDISTLQNGNILRLSFAVLVAGTFLFPPFPPFPSFLSYFPYINTGYTNTLSFHYQRPFTRRR